MPTRTNATHRRLLIRRLIERQEISSQEELVSLLAMRGHTVSQATVSRDLTAIGAVRDSLDDASVIYRLGATAAQAGELHDRFRQFVHEITSSANIVIVRTPPGGAHAVGVALDDTRDRGRLPEVLGTVAGDDTVLIVTRSARGGTRLARKLESMLDV